jgi:hypothetical protein
MTFAELCEMEPRLRDLERDVKEFAAWYGRKRCRCANAAWYGYANFHGKGFKPRLLTLVGFEREPPGYVAPVLPDFQGKQIGKLVVVSAGDPVLEQRMQLRSKSYHDAVRRLPEAARVNEKLLRSPRAYDVAYDHLYALLPNCRGCHCL